MSELIKSVRLQLAKLGGSEVIAVADNDGLRELFEKRQSLIEEMNTAKRKAADEAAKPYIDAITEVDQMYSMLLTLIGDNNQR
jgi:hypothetical protein